MLLDELFAYKNKLMEQLCSNPEIVKLITEQAEVTVPDRSLAYTHIFPYEFIPETVSDASTFICFDVDIAKVLNKTYLVPTLYIWAFTHKSKLRLPEGGVRLDKMSAEIDKILNGSRVFGLGELELYNVDRFVPIDDYQGRVLTFSAIDFNRMGYTQKPPVNRRG